VAPTLMEFTSEMTAGEQSKVSDVKDMAERESMLVSKRALYVGAYTAPSVRG